MSLEKRSSVKDHGITVIAAAAFIRIRAAGASTAANGFAIFPPFEPPLLAGASDVETRFKVKPYGSFLLKYEIIALIKQELYCLYNMARQKLSKEDFKAAFAVIKEALKPHQARVFVLIILSVMAAAVATGALF